MAKKSMVNKNKKKKAANQDIQHRNRCNVCSRPRSYIRFFGLCRICFRKLASVGHLPGVTKASW